MNLYYFIKFIEERGLVCRGALPRINWVAERPERQSISAPPRARPTIERG